MIPNKYMFLELVEELDAHVYNHLAIEHCCFLKLKHNKQCESLLSGQFTVLLLYMACEYSFSNSVF